LGRLEDAITNFRQSLDAERAKPQMQTNCWLDYSWLVASHQVIELYPEVTAILDEFNDKARLAFPLSRYRYAAIRSIILNSQGHFAAARGFAQQALNAAATTHSGFRRHPDLGMVKNTDSEIHRQLIAILKS